MTVSRIQDLGPARVLRAGPALVAPVARVLLLALLLPGCEREPAPAPDAVETATSLVDLARRPPQWLERDDAGRWRAFERADREPIQSRWRVDGPLQTLADADTLDLAAVGRAGGRLLAELPPFSPTELSAVRLRYAGTRGGSLRLAWRQGQAESFTYGLDAIEVKGGDVWQEVVLPFGAPFRAQERVTEIALLLPADEVGTVRVSGSELLLRQPPPFAPPKLELDGQLREVVDLGADRAVEWELRVPAAAELVFDYAAAPWVWLQRGDGSTFTVSVHAGRTDTLVWTRALDPYADPRQRSWQNARVDLSDWAGQTVKLRIAALSSPPAHGVFGARRDTRGDAPLISAPRVFSREAAPRRILMIVVDTLRRDALGLYGHPDDPSPRLDERAASGLVFDRAWAASSWTHPSTASFLSGWLPSRHGLGMGVDAGAAVRMDPETPWLPRALRDAGWATAAVSNNIIVSPDEGFARGFDQFDMRAFPQDQIFGAQRVTRAALEWLEGHGDLPFFLYLHYFDPHDRYQAPPPFTRQFLDRKLLREVDHVGIAGGKPTPLRDDLADAERNVTVDPRHIRYLRALYQGEVAYADHWIGRLLDRMEEAGWLENTLVVFTSDHGEEFYEHGFLKHGQSLHEELLRVPLVLLPPRGTAPPGRIDTPVSLLDLPNTLLRFAGLAPFSDGIDLLAPSRPPSRILMAENRSRQPALETGLQRAAVQWPHKLLANLDRPTRALYDLERDPGELEPLEGSSAVADTLSTALERLARPTSDGEGESLPPDPALVEKLKAMGYVH